MKSKIIWGVIVVFIIAEIGSVWPNGVVILVNLTLRRAFLEPNDAFFISVIVPLTILPAGAIS